MDGRPGRSGAVRPAQRCTRYRRARSGPANADAEISANKTVSSDITLLDQHGSEVLLGETLMVPIANSMVYLRPLYVVADDEPPAAAAVRGRRARQERADRHVAASVLSDLLNTTVVAAVGVGRVLDRHGAGGGGGNPGPGADRLHQRAGRPEGGQPGAVPDGHQADAAGDRPGARRDRRDDEHGATTTTTTVPPVKGGKTIEEDQDGDDHHATTHGAGVHDDHHVDADQHRAQERVDHDVDDAGLGGRRAETEAAECRVRRAAAARPPAPPGCGQGRRVP